MLSQSMVLIMLCSCGSQCLIPISAKHAQNLQQCQENIDEGHIENDCCGDVVAFTATDDHIGLIHNESTGDERDDHGKA